MTQIFNIGLSGAGTIGRIHAEALASIPSAKLVAVAEPRVAEGAAFVEEFGGTHYESYVDMLLHDDLDVVIIATPSGIHPDQAVLAAESGKHIITEKPMAITREGLDRMIEAADRAKVHLAVIFQNRLSADVYRLKRALEQGIFGTPLLANGTMYWRRTPEYFAASGGWRGTWALDGGGALMNQAIHTADLLQWLMGGVRDVRAHTGTLVHPIETEDTASVSFQFANGALGSLTATTAASKDWPVRIEIIGTQGRVTLEQNAIALWDAPVGKDEIPLSPEEQALVAGWAPDESFGVAHERQLRHILDTMAAGCDPYIPGREARQAVDCILAIYDAARSGTGVSPKDDFRGEE